MSDRIKLSERIKLVEIATEQHFKFLAGLGGILLLAMAVWYFWEARKSADVVAATNAKLAGILDKIDEKIDTLDVKGISKQLKGEIQDARKATTELAGFVSDAKKDLNRISASAATQIDGLGDIRKQAVSLIAEGEHQLKQNGDEAERTLAAATVFIKDTDTRVSKLLEDGSLILETANPKLQALLEHADAVVISADGTIKAYEPVGVKMASVLGHVDHMAADSDIKWHSLLFPPPVKGFWNRTKTYAGFALHSAFDGLRLYYTITSLPVRITQPIPVLK